EDGADWIGVGSASGSFGALRGIPNLVFPEGHFHPGATTSVTTILSSGPLATTFRSETIDGLWACEWTILPHAARCTVLEAAHDYWFLYEGTPGGSLEPSTDFMARPDGTITPLSVSWTGDLVGEEWVYFADPAKSQALFVAHHTDDDEVDSYRQQDNAMTVFGFGRSSTTSLLDEIPDTFTIGLVPETQPAPARVHIRSAYLDPVVIVGAAQPRETVWVHLSTDNGDLPQANGGSQQTALVVFDVDRDGVDDFVVGERTGSPSVVWYRRREHGWDRYTIDNDL